MSINYYNDNYKPKQAPKTEYHFWVSSRYGYVWALKKDYQTTILKIARMKYLGFTNDLGWPKKMNTGRILHKPSYKSRKKQIKLVL
jgi:hypothetical protein